MAASIRNAKKVVSKDDLKRLMRERKEALSQTSKRIESPFAKYNSIGKLSCVVCNMQIKSETLWSSHILGKFHKSNVEELNNRKQPVSILKKTDPVPVKRKVSEVFPVEEPPVKEKKLTNNEKEENRNEKKVSVHTSASLLSGYDSDQEMEEVSATSSKDAKEETSSSNNLPTDFFDNFEKKPLLPESSSAKSGQTEALPEGFFDDPILDAKARKVEYKDPIEEEWEKFQKAIAEETNVSEAIIEEDVAESKVERDIEEIDEQIHNWSRVNTLQQRKEDLSKNSASDVNGSNSDDESMADEEDFSEFLDWRAKGT